MKTYVGNIFKLRVALLAFICTAGLSGYADSKFAGPFAKFKQSRDRAALSRELSASENVANLKDEVPFLIALISGSDNDPELLQAARLKFVQIEILTFPRNNKELDSLFQEATGFLGKHLGEASSNPKSQWRVDIVLFGAFTGAMPTEGMVKLYTEMLDSEDSIERERALMALTRVRPLSKRVKEILLTPVNEPAELRPRLEKMILALDEKEVLATFLAYCDSGDLDTQRTASHVLSLSGSWAEPAVNALLGAKNVEDRDKDVRLNLDRAIENVKRAKQHP